MATNSRAAKINKVLKVAKRHFQPTAPPKDRPVLEHLVFASCLENSLQEHADTVFQILKNDYFDWNEVRVTSIRELVEFMKPLNDPVESARRTKRVLQSVFETQYSFDLEPMRKQNIGQAVKQLHKYKGTSHFTVAYVTQHALGGHSIPINNGLLDSMRIVGVISDGEHSKRTVPGLERAIPKTKGVEVGSQLHQLGVELHRSPYGPTIRKWLLEIDPDCKAHLPKRLSKKAPAEEEKPAKSSTKSKKTSAKVKQPATKNPTDKSKKKSTKPATKKTAGKKLPAKKKVVKKKKVKKKKPVTKKKKVVKKTNVKKASPSKKKSTTNRLKKRKPR